MDINNMYGKNPKDHKSPESSHINHPSVPHVSRLRWCSPKLTLDSLALGLLVAGVLSACNCSGDDGELPTLSIRDAVATEGDDTSGQLRFRVTLSASASGDVTVRYATVDGTATAGDDYTATSGVLTIPTGETSAEIVVPILGDTVDEPDETMEVTLADASASATIADSRATGTIVDDDMTALSAGRTLNDTGVTSCSTASANGLACRDSGLGTDQFPRQDAEVGRDAEANDDRDGHAGFSWTKLDSNGTPLPDQGVDYMVAPWPCVRDEVTGLTWEVKTDDDGLRDKDWSYSWYTSTGLHIGAAVSGLANGGICVDRESCDTDAYIEAVNGAALCGYTDWRLPTRSELLSIVNYEPLDAPVAPGGLTPFIDNIYFPNTSNALAYWSVTDAHLGTLKRSVSFKDGTSGSETKTRALAVRLARGGQ